MTKKIPTEHDLRRKLDELLRACGQPGLDAAALAKEVAAYGTRRCDKIGSDDNLKYELGAAFQVHAALDLDPIALAGLFATPFEDYPSAIALDRGQTALDRFRAYLKDPAAHAVFRERGAKLHFERLRSLYQQEVAAFEASPAAKREAWRRKKPTRRQFYLLDALSRHFGWGDLPVTTRGQAYEILKKMGGNPRFGDGASK